MRTTLDIPDEIFRQLKAEAALSGSGRAPMATFIDGKTVWEEKVDFPNTKSNLNHIT